MRSYFCSKHVKHDRKYDMGISMCINQTTASQLQSRYNCHQYCSSCPHHLQSDSLYNWTNSSVVVHLQGRISVILGTCCCPLASGRWRRRICISWRGSGHRWWVRSVAWKVQILRVWERERVRWRSRRDRLHERSCASRCWWRRIQGRRRRRNP